MLTTRRSRRGEGKDVERGKYKEYGIYQSLVYEAWLLEQAGKSLDTLDAQLDKTRSGLLRLGGQIKQEVLRDLKLLL